MVRARFPAPRAFDLARAFDVLVVALIFSALG